MIRCKQQKFSSMERGRQPINQNEIIQFFSTLNSHNLKGARFIAQTSRDKSSIDRDLFLLIQNFFDHPSVKDIAKSNAEDQLINLACQISIYALRDAGLPAIREILIIEVL